MDYTRLPVAPALRGGRGLTRRSNAQGDRRDRPVAPALRGGRGLKLANRFPLPGVVQCGSRPSGRERIETAIWILLHVCSTQVAPALRGGRGLKLKVEGHFYNSPLWLPPFGAGED